MKVIIYWNKNNTDKLNNKIKLILDELWLVDFIKVEKSENLELKKQMGIKKEPALIIEEESIDFKDIIFEWIIPDTEELKSMFISIIWWWESGWWCGTGWCGTCTSC